MERTTVYLPKDLKAALTRTARATGKSEAELIREGVQHVTKVHEPPLPRTGLFSSGIADLAENVDKYLEGFGED